MDTSSPSRPHHPPASFLARLRIVGDLLGWLVSLILLSEADLIQADVYLGQMHE